MSDNRTLFGQPISKSTTLAFYPDKMSLDDFCDEVAHSIEGYRENLCDRNLGDLYPETWAESFLAWCEIEREPKCE